MFLVAELPLLAAGDDEVVPEPDEVKLELLVMVAETDEAFLQLLLSSVELVPEVKLTAAHLTGTC